MNYLIYQLNFEIEGKLLTQNEFQSFKRDLLVNDQEERGTCGLA